jgi:arylsulfatase A-like enzyme
MNRSSLPAIVATVVVGSTLALSACGGGAAKPNVVLVVVDSLGADAVGPHGSESSVTPQIDRLSAEGATFLRAVSVASWNLPSMSSLVTSTPPWVHGQGTTGTTGAVTTLAEVFSRDGYRTAAFTEAAWPLLEKGFDTFENTAGDQIFGDPGENSAKTTVDAALAWIGRTDDTRPFFLLVHTYEAHSYFLGKPAHHAFARREHPDYQGPFRDWAIRDFSRPAADQITEALLKASPGDLAYVKSLYRGAVAEVDQQIGRLAAGAAPGATVVAVTSSNGEGFRPDLLRVHHGARLHDDVLHVPLVVAWPRHLEPARVDSLVETLDVAPTLLALASLPPEPRFTGVPLVAAEGGFMTRFRGPRFHVEAPAERTVIAEEAAFQVLPSGERAAATVPQYALYSGLVTLIDTGDHVELYDLKTDPGQEKNLAAERPEVAQSLRDTLHQVVDRAGKATAGPDADQLEQLRSLGYVQ